MRNEPTTIAESPRETWSRRRLLNELRRSASPFRWEGVSPFLWPLAALFGILSYRGFTGHAWPSFSFGCALLSFNFAVSALLHQALKPLRRKIDILTVLVGETPDPADGEGD